MTAQVTPRDLALLQEELKCLREKMSTLISTAGGYTDVLTSPGSSVYPDEYRENCSCVDVDVYSGNPLNICQTINGGEGQTNVGDIAEDIYQPGSIEGLFMFDAINGVFYLPPNSTLWDNRNTGLGTVSLEHGCKDVWWYRKNTPTEDNVILWRVGIGTVLTSLNAGRINWISRAPEPPTGYTLGQIRFTQILSDPFNQDKFFLVGTVGYTTYIWKTTDNGQSWEFFDLTPYNSVSQRFPIWMALSGNGGSSLWITTWGDGVLRLTSINTDTLAVGTEVSLGSATEWEARNYFEVWSPATALDSTSVWLFGRASNPSGLAHIIRTDNNGSSWTVVENTWGLDWCGSLRVSLASSGQRNLYSVRNVR